MKPVLTTFRVSDQHFLPVNLNILFILSRSHASNRESSASMRVISLVLLLTASSSAVKQKSFSSIGANEATAEAKELNIFVNMLIEHYTPQCLRILLYTNATHDLIVSMHTDGMNKISHGTIIYPKTWNNRLKENNSFFSVLKPKPHIIVNSDMASQTQNCMKYINELSNSVIPSSCVTYVLTETPDLNLLSLLTASSYRQLTRYFYVYTQSFRERKKFLLDEHWRDQENVITLSRHTRLDSVFWQASVRQLMHPSGSPLIQVVNRWNAYDVFKKTQEVFPEQMGNFYGLKFTAVSLAFKPFIDYQVIEGSKVVRSKPCVDIFILDVIAKTLNFTYELVMPEDGQWGYVKKDVSVVMDFWFCR